MVSESKTPPIDDNPEWTVDDFACARPAVEVLPPKLYEALTGRPKAARPKKSVTIRLDQDVIDHFKAMGAGWQSQINETLRKAVGR
jgi:uncharacterized protein (DUF4415 family)